MTRNTHTPRQLDEIQHHSTCDWPLTSWIVSDSIFPRRYTEFLQVLDRLYPGKNGLSGMRILDCGCGFGAIAVALAQRGALVEAFDLSPNMVEISRRLARENHVEEQVTIRESAMEHLPYPDSYFDVVAGTAVLHHVDIPSCSPQIRRVLKPGGLALFLEPIVNNPWREKIRKFYRRRLSFLIPGTSTAEEHPVTPEEIELIGQDFVIEEKTACSFTPISLLGGKLLHKRKSLYRKVMPALRRLDGIVDGTLPFLRDLLENDHILVLKKPA